MKIKLTKKQEKYAEAIEWLLDPNGPRAEGRTFLMAYTFIKLALQNRGTWIQVFDHFAPAPITKKFLLNQIINIVCTDKKLLEEFQIRHSVFAFRFK